jgi:hypothetical protein
VDFFLYNQEKAFQSWCYFCSDKHVVKAVGIGSYRERKMGEKKTDANLGRNDLIICSSIIWNDDRTKLSVSYFSTVLFALSKKVNPKF